MSTGPALSVGAQGLSQLAHAIRRSTALHTAMMVSPEGTTDTQLLARADLYSSWLAGAAGRQEQSDDDHFIGENPWSPS